MEVYYALLSGADEGFAEKAYSAFLPFCVDFDDETIKKAMKFRFLEKDRKLSYVDAMGYEMANKFSAKFLTGDKQFEKMPNVEWVK